jgi:RNA polymerase sigma factor (sigma-70 family)
MHYHDRQFGTARAQQLRRGAARRRGAPEPGEIGSVLQAALDGSEPAWAWLLERFSARIRSIARSYRLASEDVDDIIQITWLRLLEYAGNVREPDHLGAWLSTTAKRESLRVASRSRRVQPTGDGFADEPLGPGPEVHVLAAERKALVAEALTGLPERHARLIRRLFAESNPSYSEIAEALEIPMGSIGPIRGRALARLRRNLALRSLAEGVD